MFTKASGQGLQWDALLALAGLRTVMISLAVVTEDAKESKSHHEEGRVLDGSLNRKAQKRQYEAKQNDSSIQGPKAHGSEAKLGWNWWKVKRKRKVLLPRHAVGESSSVRIV